jgi:hypothetical protein
MHVSEKAEQIHALDTLMIMNLILEHDCRISVGHDLLTTIYHEAKETPDCGGRNLHFNGSLLWLFFCLAFRTASPLFFSLSLFLIVFFLCSAL